MELLRTAFAQLVARDEKTRVGEEETEEEERLRNEAGNEVSIASDVDERAAGLCSGADHGSLTIL